MDQVPVSLAYIGTGCNRSAHVMDWGASNLICFGACNSVAVYDPTAGKIVLTLVGHKDEVNCVKWVRGTQNELVSGSSDSSVIAWTLEKHGDTYQKSYSVLAGHSSSILAVDSQCQGDYGTVVASSASDSTVRIWRRSDGSKDFVNIIQINTGSCFALCVNMITMPNSNVILLCYGTDAPEVMLHSVYASELECETLANISGHEDWVRSVDLKILGNGDVLIASSSQDMIRISRLSQNNDDASDNSFNVKKDEIIINDLLYFLSFESVLYGHEGWIYSVNWSPFEDSGSPCLLSASFDRTLIIWKPCTDSGVWLEESRMGELGGDNSLGYYGAKFNPDGTSILAYSYQGSFHLWSKTEDKWVTQFFIGGHSEAVTDICWEKKGRYLISVSSDKTTRLHAPYLKGTQFKVSPWCELSRPQIHGHSLHSLTTLSNLGFASCSEEKVIRVFSPSYSVLKLLNYFCDSLFEEEVNSGASWLPSSASIPALGLSNKADYGKGEVSEPPREFDVNQAIDDKLSPNEDYIVQNTLWPEVMKLYRHGNDVFSMAVTHDGGVLATASKATAADQAKIILWDTKTWNIITQLEGHQLTVTQMKFSPDDSYLLSVSRDRKWCLFKKSENNSYTFHSKSEKGGIVHSRIIWTCAWTHDGLFFATGSRDCKIIIWDFSGPLSQRTSSTPTPITALDFAPISLPTNRYILAVGNELGSVELYIWSHAWSLLHIVHPDIGHHLTVHRLQFRPLIERTGNENPSQLHLASCSEDRSVRVYHLDVTNL